MLTEKQYVALWGIYQAALPGVTHIHHDEQVMQVYDIITKLETHKNAIIRKQQYMK
jgi:hypothetical protein